MEIKITEKALEECLVKSFQSKKFENTAKEEPRRDSEGQSDHKGVKVYLRWVVPRQSSSVTALHCYCWLKTLVTHSHRLLLVAGNVREALSAGCKQTVVNQIDRQIRLLESPEVPRAFT